MQENIGQNQENRATEPETHHSSRSRPSTQPNLPPPIHPSSPNNRFPTLGQVQRTLNLYEYQLASWIERWRWLCFGKICPTKKWEKGPSSTWPEGTMRGLAPSKGKLITRIFKTLRAWGIFSYVLTLYSVVPALPKKFLVGES